MKLEIEYRACFPNDYGFFTPTAAACSARFKQMLTLAGTPDRSITSFFPINYSNSNAIFETCTFTTHEINEKHKKNIQTNFH
jgi:hypothetical protein